MRRLALFLVVLFPFLLNAQKLKRADKVLIQNLENHIKFLASDELEGRRAGTAGEQKAVDYIVAQYQALKLTPMGEQGFVQSFPIAEGKRFSSNAFIKVNNSSLGLTKDFFPLSNSGSAAIQSRAAITLNEAKQVWFKDLQEVLEENASNPHFDINAWVVTKSEELVKKGATALFLHNSGTVVDNIQYNKIQRFDMSKISSFSFLLIPVALAISGCGDKTRA